MTKIEYLSYSKPKRIALKFVNFFASIPAKLGKKFRKVPSFVRKVGKFFVSPFITLKDALVHGDWKTRLSFLVMGFGHVTRHQIIRGILYFIYEVVFISFFIMFGLNQLINLPTLGQLTIVIHYKPSTIPGLPGVYAPVYYDYSINILIYAIFTILLTIIFVVLWYSQIKDSLKMQREGYIGFIHSDKVTLKNVLDKSYHKTLLTIPMAGLVLLTILPIVITIIIGFTSYDSYHEQPTALVDWVGFQNFGTVLSMGSSANNTLVIQTFGQVVLWTLVWAIFATFSNYFLGMAVAILINSKIVKLKKLWRTILITTIAVPQFVSLMLINRMFNEDLGIVNSILSVMAKHVVHVRWLSDPIITKIFIIVANTWVGIPYTMLISSGILMNIPEDLYESARIDGASPFKTFAKITLPYMLFVTGPYLISQFVGNINNFNVIYLLSGGNPLFTFGTQLKPDILQGVGQTDLLITWIYKLTFTYTPALYSTASVLGIFIFAIVAVISLIFYGNSNAVKNEEDFQ